ncbi:MAG: nucleotidyltransferase domain-containing protein [Flavobacteriales bacterium]|jgi:predicted nucleotidyltransferase|nr:nucleotidyltransferase domain-containing protein [Flavobacteriales bacterium]MBK6891658.1 nucleotidyltransferase domain-containing protein [Flavobacteriales bacterium]MBK7247584.1 nucleotidyltransferase domain-containing protein [Flavobacteriales bacterium]MBK7286524.1 nucleotidyltransferase domain-containing protein [Flavobacteriales bacterium]MBK9596947.1 nucleotidyltransferase domain-containing protein [Flavobacteriales bacterium]
MLELSSDHLAIVRAILAEHVPQAKAWAFGSRVLGTAKKFSDLDIAIEAEDELSIGTLGDLRYAFAESDLPISVDLLDMRTVRMPFKTDRGTATCAALMRTMQVPWARMSRSPRTLRWRITS